MRILLVISFALMSVSVFASDSGVTLHQRLVARYEQTVGEWPGSRPDIAPWVLRDDGLGNLSITGKGAPRIADLLKMDVSAVKQSSDALKQRELSKEEERIEKEPTVSEKVLLDRIAILDDRIMQLEQRVAELETAAREAEARR